MNAAQSASYAAKASMRQRYCIVSRNVLSKAYLELEKHLAGAVCSFVSA